MLRKLTVLLLLAGVLAGSALVTTRSVRAAPDFTCLDLDGAYVLSQQANSVYLGFFGSQYANESILNQYGPFGSRFAANSMWNQYGAYGSPYQPYSAFNPYTTTPPGIFKNGYLLGFVTTNATIAGGVPLDVIAADCTFYATAPVTSNPPPPPPVPAEPAVVAASDGLFTDRVRVEWTPVQGATHYVVGWAVNPSGTAIFSENLTGTSYDVTGLPPGVLYDFGVTAVNAYGNSLFTFDTGYVAQAQATATATAQATAPATATAPAPPPATQTPIPPAAPAGSAYLPLVKR